MTIMHNIAIIGAGQLGRRHLQGLAQSNLKANLYVVDPSESSLEAARLSLDEVQSQGVQEKFLHYCGSVADLPVRMDLVIVATTADVRLDVLQALCASAPPRYLVLEKVLFQRLADYHVAEQLFTEHGIVAWVNCTRRIFPVYQNLREFFSDDQVRSMEVAGGEWGLGCNSIHFLDFLQFLAGAGQVSILTDGLSPEVIKSKRSGFVEFSGTLRGNIGNAEFRLTSVAGSSKRHLISLHASGSKSVFIDEARGELWKHEGSEAKLEKFSLPYVSQTSRTLAEDILNTSYCQLTPYSESKILHIPLLQALGCHLSGSSVSVDSCLIT